MDESTAGDLRLWKMRPQDSLKTGWVNLGEDGEGLLSDLQMTQASRGS